MKVNNIDDFVKMFNENAKEHYAKCLNIHKECCCSMCADRIAYRKVDKELVITYCDSYIGSIKVDNDIWYYYDSNIIELEIKE